MKKGLAWRVRSSCMGNQAMQGSTVWMFCVCKTANTLAGCACGWGLVLHRLLVPWHMCSHVDEPVFTSVVLWDAKLASACVP